MNLQLNNLYRMVKKSNGVFIALAFCVLLFSCGSNKQPKAIIDIDDTLDMESFIAHKRTENNYRIPTPIDLFLLLDKEGALFIEEALNAPVKRVQYNSTASKAINFGIYTTDLAYCSVFGNFQGSLVYFNTAKELAVDLGMYEGYGEEMAYRINNNLNSIDSLIDISTDSYYQTTNFLESQGLSDILALIMVGCWIESIYMTIESVDTFNIESAIIERVADQRFLLENLVDLLKLDKESESVKLVLEQLIELQEVYDVLYYNSEETFITKSQYVNIANKIREVREGFVG